MLTQRFRGTSVVLQNLKRWFARAAKRRHSGVSGACPLQDASSSANTVEPAQGADHLATARLHEPPGQYCADATRAAIETALRSRPDDAGLNYRMGMICLAEGDAAGALDFLHLALHYAPDSFAACAARVKALLSLGRAAEVAEIYREFLRANPGAPEAAYALALWHHGQGKHELAVELLRPLVDRPSPRREALNLLGLILGRELGQLGEGEHLLRRALEQDPFWQAALSNLGWLLLEKGDYQQGLQLLDAALARNPEDHETRLMRAYMNLKHGEFDAGWRDYEARLQSSFAVNPPNRFTQWDGTPIGASTLLISGEQGLGDQIMFASCFGEAIARAGRCVVECDPKLVKLFARSFPAARVQAAAPPGAADSRLLQSLPIDRQILMGSLPRFWRGRWSDFPQHTGYLRAAPERIAYWRARLDALGSGPKIGLSWRGGVAATRRHLRSIDLEEFLPLLRKPVKFVSLQYGDCADDLNALCSKHGLSLPHWRDAIDDYDETAALICALDLVISVCTAVIHLTGALGKPVWVLVPAVAEWRYLDRGEALPWYPSARLYRQTQTGSGWEGVINRVAQELPHECEHIGG